MPTYRLDLAYDGSGFHGYARQPDLRTVQGDLERALRLHTGDVDTFVAGRTDKGVHATGQVVSFEGPPIDVERVQRSLNSQLAPEIAVSNLREAAPGFHARFSATGRAYVYRINPSGVHDPLSASHTWTIDHELDVDAMNEAVEALVGEHDFASFCRRQGDAPTTRRLEWAVWAPEGDLVRLSIGASSFCHQMVRSIVAVSVEVGRGRVAASEVPSILEAKDRSRAKGAAPAHGLTLVAVSYGEEDLPVPEWARTDVRHQTPDTS